MRLRTASVPPVSVPQGRLLPGVVAIAALSTLLAGALSLGGGWTKFTLAGAIVFCAGAVLVCRRPALLARGLLVVELPILLLILDVYYSNARSASDLSSNPLNSGAMVKLAAVCLAGLIGGITYATHPVGERRIPLPFRLFALYAVAVFLALPASVNSLLTTYRGIEVVAGVLAVAGAYRAHGHDAVVRLERLLYAVVAALVLSVWVGVVVAPHSAFVPLPLSPLHWQIVGVQPPIASNGVGTLGVVLALWSVARLASTTAQDRMRRSYAVAFLGLGVATSIAAQYRTGYVELAAGLALLLLLKGRKALALLMATVVTAGAVWGFSGAVTSARPFLLRGDTTQQAEQLSGRQQIWHAAMPYWRKSPIFGRGLLTSTRLEVLPSIGYTDTANAHSTWVETLVGTGLVGTVLLAAALLLLFGRAVRVALRPGGRVVPAVLLLALVVRSITGDSVESLGLGALLLLTFALDPSTPLPLLRPRERVS